MRRFLFHLEWCPLFCVPSFCKGPLILYDFWFPNLQNKGPTVTVTNIKILTALFQAVTGTRPWLRFCVAERNREPTFFRSAPTPARDSMIMT